jgi:hypothetical protein
VLVWAGLAGLLRSGYRIMAGGLAAGLRRRFAVGAGGVQRDAGGGEQEDRAGQQGLVEACGERLAAGAWAAISAPATVTGPQQREPAAGSGEQRTCPDGHGRPSYWTRWSS